MAIETVLKVGANVDIVFENELMKGNAHYMKALVYDYEGSTVITSQTSPALNRNFFDRRVIVTFLVKAERRILRFGFPAKLNDLIPNYRIASDKDVEALVLEQLAKTSPMDFRMHFRVKHSLSSNIRLRLREGEVTLINISLGGAKFSCPRNYLLRPADEIKADLSIGRTVFNLKCRICDVRDPVNLPMSEKNIQHVSIQFESVNSHLEALLSRAVMEMERQLLSEGKL